MYSFHSWPLLRTQLCTWHVQNLAPDLMETIRANAVHHPGPRQQDRGAKADVEAFGWGHRLHHCCLCVTLKMSPDLTVVIFLPIHGRHVSRTIQVLHIHSSPLLCSDSLVCGLPCGLEWETPGDKAWDSLWIQLRAEK